ncbi:hypothetical protein L6R52_42695 [Myxococcota bacterium]|nr:hypothetical protein [Myxococcota bacterium]
MSLGNVGSGMSLDALVFAVQRSNVETQEGMLAEAASRFDATKARVEAERVKVNDAEADVLDKEAELDAHVDAGPNPLDAFFLKGAVHESGTKAKKAEVAAEQAEVASAEAELKRERRGLSDALDEVRATFERLDGSRGDTESLLDESAKAADLILGRLRA